MISGHVKYTWGTPLIAGSHIDIGQVAWHWPTRFSIGQLTRPLQRLLRKVGPTVALQTGRQVKSCRPWWAVGAGQ
jgi:hypothetical protein